MSAWKTARRARACNTFPDVWAAIVGCTGSGKSWRYGVGHFGRQTAEFACEACKAAQDRSEALRGPAHTAHLRALSEAAGVADYRVAEVVRIDGRPVLTGKVDVHAAREAASDALYRFTGKAGLTEAVDALRVYHAAGGDCRALIAASRIPAHLVAQLRAGWRSSAA